MPRPKKYATEAEARSAKLEQMRKANERRKLLRQQAREEQIKAKESGEVKDKKSESTPEKEAPKISKAEASRMIKALAQYLA